MVSSPADQPQPSGTSVSAASMLVEYGGASMWGPGKFAVADDQGPRMEEVQYLYERMG